MYKRRYIKTLLELYKSDLLGFLGVLLFSVFIIGAIWLGMFLIKKETERQYDLSTQGKITKVNLHTTQSQYHDGNKIVVQGFTVHYVFQLNQKDNYGEFYVSKATLNYNGINQLLYPDTSKYYVIKYQSQNPSQNMIVID